MALGFLNRWRQDRRGVSAIEFAFIAPILILCYFAVAELCGAMLAERKASHVASEIGDLIAQDQTVHDTDITDLWTVGTAVMAPLSTTTLKMRITSINCDATGKILTVGWSDDNGAGLTKYAKGTVLTSVVPTGLVTANGSIIMSETQYSYSSPVNVVIKKALTFPSTFYLSPRQTTVITRVSP
jgi:Flp pilus assembly protein TadG